MSSVKVLVIALIVSVLSGAAGGAAVFFFKHFFNKEQTAVTVVDVAKIVDNRRLDFLKRYKDKTLNDKTAKQMTDEMTSFSKKLSEVLAGLDSKIIFVKQAVIENHNVKDITPEVETLLKEKEREAAN